MFEKAVLSPIPEAMEVTADADSSHGEDSESDSDSDSDSEADDKLQVQTLESELYNNPSNYDAHVQVCFSASDRRLTTDANARKSVATASNEIRFKLLAFYIFTLFA